MNKEFQVAIRAITIAAIILQVLFVGLAIVWPMIAPEQNTFWNSLLVGLNLFLLWLVVTSTLRSINRIVPGVNGGLLLMSGLGIGVLSLMLQYGIFYMLKMTKNTDLVQAPKQDELFFFMGICFVVSFLAMIKLKVESNFWGNVLEVLFIGALAFFFFYYWVK